MPLYRTGARLPIAGLDTSKPAEYIAGQNSPDCDNVDVVQDVLQSRKGTNIMGAVIASGANLSILNGMEFQIGELYLNVRVGTTIAEKWNSIIEGWDSITGVGDELTATDASSVSLATPLLSGVPILTFTNGVDPIQKWTGTGNHADLGGTPPIVKFIANFGSYLMYANVVDDGGGDTYQRRVGWADTGDPEEWDTVTTSAGNQLLVDGGDITGMAQYGNYISVHKKDLIYLGYETGRAGTFRFDAKYTNGAIANNTIKMLPNGLLVYLASDGIRAFNGATSAWIDTPVNEQIKRTLNVDSAYKAFAIVNQELNEYWVAVPIGEQSSPSTIYRFNYEDSTILKSSTPYALRSGWGFANSENVTWDDLEGTWDEQTLAWDEFSSANLIEVPTLSDEDGKTYKTTGTTNNDNGTAINNTWTSKEYTAENEGQMSRWKMMEIWAKGNTIKLEYSIDKGDIWVEVDSYSLLDTYPLDSAPLVAYFDVVATQIRFRFSNNVINETFTLKQFIIYHTPREARLN